MSLEHSQLDCKTCTQRFASVLCKVKYNSIEQINEERICTFYKKGQVIFHEGSRPFGIYCVNSGKIKLSKFGDDGKEQLLRLVKPGDLMGYRSLLSQDKYSVSAVALEDSGVCFIPKELFMGILQKDGAFSMEIMKLLSDDLRKAEISITHLAQRPVRERLAEALLFIKESYGFEADNSTLNLKLSREELANLVGTATETVIRLLSEFKSDNIISLEGKKIKVISHAKLVSTANLDD